MTKALILTNCTASSFVETESTLEGASLGTEFTTSGLTKDWQKRIEALANNAKKYTALELYKGLSLTSVLKMQDYFDGTEICIASLGFGLIREADTIYSYNLNLENPTSNEASLYNRVTKEKFLPERWWSLLNETLYGEKFPISALLNKGKYDIAIITTTARFLSLIAEDLSQIKDFSKVRILGVTKSTVVPLSLRKSAPTEIFLPYDRRITRTIPGNRTDFPHRCALHYVKEIMPKHYNDIAAENTAILQALHDINPSGTTERIVLPAKKLSDIIKKMKDDGLSGQMAYNRIVSLRYKCSAKKFDLIWSGALDDIIDPTENNKYLIAAKEALKHVSFTPTTAVDYSEVLEGIAIFKEVIRDADPEAVFTARDISSWAHQYYQILGRTLPETLASAAKLSHFISELSAELNIESIESVASQGPTQYRINYG